MNKYHYFAKIIFYKIIDKTKTDEENVERISEYLKNRQYELVSSLLQRIRTCLTEKEQEIKDELD